MHFFLSIFLIVSSQPFDVELSMNSNGNLCVSCIYKKTVDFYTKRKNFDIKATRLEYNKYRLH